MNNASPPHALPDWPYPRWVAHRGAGKLAPENTLAAFRLGAQHGYRMFECDAKLSSDGVVFLMHDATLNRTTSGHGVGGDRSWHDLAQLDAGSWHSRAYAGEPLLTLANLARFCRHNHYLLNIEIKPTPGTERHTGEVVGREAAALWAGAESGKGAGTEIAPLLTSFQPEALAGAKATAPSVPRGLLLDSWRDGWLAQAQELGCQAVVCNYALWDATTVSQVHAAGMRCLSYTVNDEWAAAHLLALGTDGIITDRVDLFSPV